jgi:hypothetical protein
MIRRAGIADEQPSSLGGWLFADMFLLLVVVGFSAFTSNNSDLRPTVKTDAATAVAQHSVVLNGSVIAKKQKTDVFFEWSTSPTLTDARVLNVKNSPVSGAQVDTSFQAIPGYLESKTTYYFRAVARNASGIAKGKILSFETKLEAPCDPNGAKFLKVPLQRTIKISDIKDLFRRLRERSKSEGLSAPKVAVAVISGWTENRSGSKGQERAGEFYKLLKQADQSQEFFYEDTALSDWQSSKLAKNYFDVVLYLVDLADRCE